MSACTSPQILITPLKPAIIAGTAQKLSVLVRVQAPDPDPSRQASRKPYHLALVIDRSGSMSGAPLHEAVRCARHIVDRMAPTDRASLVVFDDRIKTLVPAGPVGDRKALHSALLQIHSGGSTDLHGGWQAGADSLFEMAADAALARVILLSDGNANAGEFREVGAIAAFCRAVAGRGVTTSTYGLGRDFNEDLMVAMARQGQGNHYYGDTAADLFEPFAEEFDLIASLHSRHVRLSLKVPDGARMNLLNTYETEPRDGFSAIRLPDIPWGAEAWAIVDIEIPAALASGTSLCLLQAGVTAVSPEGQPVIFQDAMIEVGVASSSAWEVMLPDPVVAERLAELEVGELLTAARTAAEQGDWELIESLLIGAKARYGQFPWVTEVLENMAALSGTMDTARFRKEALYSSSKLYCRLSVKGELDHDRQMEVPSYLRKKRAQGKAQFDDGKPGDPS